MLPPPPPLLPPPAALPPPLLLAPPTCHPPGPLTCVGGSGGVVVAPCAERPPLLVWRPPLDASLPPLLVELCCRLPRRLCCGWVLPDADPLAWCPWPFLPRREAFCCSEQAASDENTASARVQPPAHVTCQHTLRRWVCGDDDAPERMLATSSDDSALREDSTHAVTHGDAEAAARQQATRTFAGTRVG